MSRQSKQDAFADNLRNGLGEAFYHPVPFRASSGRVGDIAYLNQDGRYEWIRNVFDSDVDGIHAGVPLTY